VLVSTSGLFGLARGHTVGEWQRIDRVRLPFWANTPSHDNSHSGVTSSSNANHLGSAPEASYIPSFCRHCSRSHRQRRIPSLLFITIVHKHSPFANAQAHRASGPGVSAARDRVTFGLVAATSNASATWMDRRLRRRHSVGVWDVSLVGGIRQLGESHHDVRFRRDRLHTTWR